MNRPPIPNPFASSSSANLPPPSDDPFDIENRARRPVSDEARAKTIDFLSRLNRDGLVRETRKYENEEIKENCYFSCSQTLQGALEALLPPASYARANGFYLSLLQRSKLHLLDTSV